MNACCIIRESNNLRFYDCSIIDFWYGVCLGTSYETGYNVWVENCYFNNCNSDIDLYGKPTVIIKNNVSYNCTENSMQFEPVGTLDNTIFDYTKQPYNNSLSVASQLCNNTIVNCANLSIALFPACEDIIISHNVIINYGLFAIYCRNDGPTNVVISNNIISNTLKDAPTSIGDYTGCAIFVKRLVNVNVIGNTIRHAGNAIMLESTEGGSVSNNTIYDSMGAAICINSTKECSINGNKIVRYDLSGKIDRGAVYIYRATNIQFNDNYITGDATINNYSLAVYGTTGFSANNLVATGFKIAMVIPSTLGVNEIISADNVYSTDIYHGMPTKGTWAERPINPPIGWVFYLLDSTIPTNTPNGRNIVYFDGGWANVDGTILANERGETNKRPGLGSLATDNRGFVFYDTTLECPITWNGTTWLNPGGTLTTRVVII